MRRMALVVWTALALVWMGAFSPAGAGLKQPESVLDTPEAHYRQGMRRLEEGDLKAAIAEFQRAIKLNEKYAGAYLGAAMVYATQGDFKTAMRNVNEARRRNKKWADVYITKGRILAMQGKKHWLKDALKAYAKARKLDARDDRVPFYEGEAYWQAGDYRQAEDAYSRAIDLKGSMQDRAARRLAQVQMVQRAAPGTQVGLRVARMDPATRGDLCALLVDELKVEELAAKFRKKTYDTGFKPPGTAGAEPAAAVPEDIARHWAKSWILRVLALDIPGLGLYPDGTFGPDRAVTRKDLAQVLQGLLVLMTGDESLGTKFVGTESRFPDVRPDVYYYNAAALSVERGLMRVDKLEGTFRPDDTVSGAEAVLAIKDLKSALMTQ